MRADRCRRSLRCRYRAGWARRRGAAAARRGRAGGSWRARRRSVLREGATRSARTAGGARRDQLQQRGLTVRERHRALALGDVPLRSRETPRMLAVRARRSARPSFSTWNHPCRPWVTRYGLDTARPRRAEVQAGVDRPRSSPCSSGGYEGGQPTLSMNLGGGVAEHALGCRVPARDAGRRACGRRSRRRRSRRWPLPLEQRRLALLLLG